MLFGTDDPRLVQEAVAATYGMIAFVEHEVGRVLTHLERLRIADDTIVVFTSDHGDIMGDHALMVKGNMHHQGVVRVPLTVAGPGVDAGRGSGLVSSIDLAPTLLDGCGITPYRNIQSLSPLRDGTSSSIRGHVLIEDDLQPEIADLLGVPAHMRTLITDEVRFTRDSMGCEQLVDLAVDPDEVEDRSDSDPRRAELATAMVDAKMAVADNGGVVGRTRIG